MKTDRVYILENPDPPVDSGIVVSHTYIKDGKRNTAFYLCGNEVAANDLVEILGSEVMQSNE